MSDIRKSINSGVYNANHKIAEAASKVPLVGDELVGMQKAFCDYVINPLVIGGTHVGCDAVDDVYHGLNNTKPPATQSQEK